MTEHRIPNWLPDHCLQDLNTTRDWMNHPFLYTVNEETWVVATDGYSLIALKTPITDSHEMQTAYLNSLDNTYIKSFIDDLFNRAKTESKQLININKLKSQLTSINANKICSSCDNTRQIACGTCEGSTEMVCSRCNGQGSQPCVTCQKPDACDPCDGLGVVECNACENGMISCSCVGSENNTIQIGGSLLNIKRLQNLLKHHHGKCIVSTNYASALFKGDVWLACLACVKGKESSLATINLSALA